ncbi:MAG: hydantoinase B/oxoprolinase family protein [Aquificota bacterium]|nr:hydantoinase B/oxoprolinase family protein [Aquificota bacterium]
MELLLEVFKNKLISVAEEMGSVLQRTAFSPNIKERRDLSCAVFTKKGDLIAQAAHIPVHLGSMGSAVREALGRVRMEEGDMVILNNPYMGGTHLPDITLVAPVTFRGEVRFFVASRAHHADVGGSSSGSMPLSREIFQEGIVIPPIKLVEGGEVREDVLDLILSNVRTPEERIGDLKAQIMANSVGVKRLREIMEEMGPEEVERLGFELMNYSERLMKGAIRRIPDGTYNFEDFMEDDGFGREDIAIRVTLRIEGDRAVVDLSRSDPQTEGTVNTVRSVTLASVYYVFRCLLPEDAPTNDGCFRPVEVITRKGTVVDAEFPSPVAGGNVETSQRIVDVVLGALAQAVPDLIPAASQGTMNNLTIGGKTPETGQVFTYYETIGGGMGAWKGGDGESAVHSHMTNTMNTPVEALEHAYPLLVREYSVRRGSGGGGRWRGGDGIVREIEVLCPAEVTVISERRRRRPYGLFGGKPGREGRNVIIRQGKEEVMPGKFTARLSPGDRIRIETPGGGGYA